MRNAFILLVIVALAIVGVGALNNGVAFNVDYVAGTANAVSLLWVSGLLAVLILVVGMAAAWFAQSAMKGSRRKLEAELQSTYERLREAEALAARRAAEVAAATAAAAAAAEVVDGDRRAEPASAAWRVRRSCHGDRRRRRHDRQRRGSRRERRSRDHRRRRSGHRGGAGRGGDDAPARAPPKRPATQSRRRRPSRRLTEAGEQTAVTMAGDAEADAPDDAGPPRPSLQPATPAQPVPRAPDRPPAASVGPGRYTRAVMHS